MGFILRLEGGAGETAGELTLIVTASKAGAVVVDWRAFATPCF
ncbi:hypothetical protein [Sphingomonas gellani]|nr:hypothetical protein [Sphingomonas gellani]